VSNPTQRAQVSGVLAFGVCLCHVQAVWPMGIDSQLGNKRGRNDPSRIWLDLMPRLIYAARNHGRTSGRAMSFSLSRSAQLFFRNGP
jgi:hypothetical protein